MRRGLLALAVSVVMHAALAGLVVGGLVFDGLKMAPRVSISTVTVEINELPLGAPPAAAPGRSAASDAVVAPRPRRKPRLARGPGAPSGDGGVADSGSPDAGAGDAGTPG